MTGSDFFFVSSLGVISMIRLLAALANRINVSW
jgi:hypothetical protein